MKHLSSEQIARWMAGERTADERHALECPQCQAEIARMESALSKFRSAVHELGEEQSAIQTVWTPERTRRAWGSHQARWAAACIALLVMAVIPVYHSARERQRAEMVKADAALLEQVDAEISRAVPTTMEPLANLAAWDTSVSTNETKTQKGAMVQ